MLDTQRGIIRQNALAHADQMFARFIEYPSDEETKKANERLMNEYFAFAGRCEEWIFREVEKNNKTPLDIDAEMKYM